jgi:tetratricopeptide (TPR) repeat protein
MFRSTDPSLDRSGSSNIFSTPMQLAQALQLKGDKTAAEAYLDRVKRLNRLYNLIMRVRSPKQGNQTTDLAELGDACEEAGLREEAKCWYTLAITVNPLDYGAQQALYRLRDLATSSARCSPTTP